MNIMIYPASIVPAATTTTTLTSVLTNDDGTINRDSLITSISFGASTALTVETDCDAKSVNDVYVAKQYIESMDNEELSTLLEKIEGKIEEPQKEYKK